MRTRAVTPPVRRVLRALLLTPLLAGVLAMHVLLVCAGTHDAAMAMPGSSGQVASAAGHHGAVAPPVSGMLTAALAVGVDAAPAAASAVAVATAPGSGATHDALGMCLAVLLGAALLLALARASRRRGHAAVVAAAPPRRGWSARPPPVLAPPHLLCVSRT